MSQNMQDVIVWFEGEIEKLKRSPTREMIKTNICDLEEELASLKARYPQPVRPEVSKGERLSTGNPQPHPEDAASNP